MTKRFLIVALAALMAGCTVVPLGTVQTACKLIETANTEADLAPGWYIEAGPVLAQCGVKDAVKWSKIVACYAERRNGSLVECEEEIQ